MLLLLMTYQAYANDATNAYFNRIKTNPNALYAFLKDMPKGGELHYHLSGGAYPETMLALAAKGDYCLDKTSFIITKGINHCLGITARDLPQNPSLYQQTLRSWSLKDFHPGRETSEDHFFASFYKFIPIVADYSPELLSEVMQRAADQNELYLEIMILPDKGFSTTFANQAIDENQFAAKRKELLENKDFVNNIQYSVDEAKRILQLARQRLGCDSKPTQKVCDLTIKFQFYVLREQSLEKVFAQALNAFEAAAKSTDVVAINLVQAEDGFRALRDYHKQMQVFDFFHKIYPGIHISLHAGELSPSSVVPENLRFHIHDAIQTGHAQRIGHGVDIAYENDAEKILQQMAQDKIAVEINLTSNKKLLHISGSRHPLKEYLAYKVPVVLSTDDEGILRTDLTRQYVAAAIVHQLNYPTLKRISRNALTYSFLPGKSLWADAEQAKTVASCQNLKHLECLKFIKNNEKARLQRQLELGFESFESKFKE